MSTDTQVVVGYDGSSDSLAALSWAAKTAFLRGESIVVTTVIDPRNTPRGIAYPEAYWQDLEDKARKALAESPDVPTSIERHNGHLVPRLIELSASGSMLVLGSHGHGLVAEIFRGSVSQSAARHATKPVVVVRPPFNAESGRIIVGTDDSEASRRALDFACEMAGVTGDKVVALRAWQETTHATDGLGYVPPSSDGVTDAESALSRTVDDLRVSHPDIPVVGEVFNGSAEKGLVAAADNASLVVVGSRGHTAVGEVFLGSVGKAVLHRAHCPVAVVH